MSAEHPVLNEKAFENCVIASPSDEVMTIDGVIYKTGFLLIITILSAIFVWHIASAWQDGGLAVLLIVGGLIGGLIIGNITIKRKKIVPLIATLYAILEGFMLAGINWLIPGRGYGYYDCNVYMFHAVPLTLGALLCLLLICKLGLIKKTGDFKVVAATAVGAIALVYLTTMALIFLKFQTIKFIIIPEDILDIFIIAVSLVILIVASLNLVCDFDFIESVSAPDAPKHPKYMEWYAAFGLIVSLVWLYVAFFIYTKDWRSCRTTYRGW